ncbi:hypothetical protein [Pseudogemmobacter sp. W21_MBD1_M6]|uniref:hypothetical protein n=1 Tax=Pseudogemmobacter sp. W21_MBD1_M6 TaxID=3240271 RepID=UPI003F9E7ED0
MSIEDKESGRRVVLVLGPWSSGSTAVVGYLARIGAWTCPPHQLTNDPLTPDSHEPKAFRDALCSVFDEITLNPTRPVEFFTEFFATWLRAEQSVCQSLGHTTIALKHPLSAFAIPQILSICDPEILVVVRPIGQIEKTRKRRGWHPVYGADGARRIYGSIFSSLIGAGRSFSAVSYPDFLANPATRLKLCQVANLSPGSEKIRAAENWLRLPVTAAGMTANED